MTVVNYDGYTKGGGFKHFLFCLGSGLRHPFSGDPKLAESLGGLIAGFGFHV